MFEGSLSLFESNHCVRANADTICKLLNLCCYNPIRGRPIQPGKIKFGEEKIMRIRVRYQYKNYPFAPRASRNSRALAIFTTWPMLACAGFFWICIVNFALASFIASSDACLVIAFISLVPCIFLVRSFKMHMAARIDVQAAKETLRTLSAGQAD